MNMHSDTTAAAERASENRDIGDAIDILCRALCFNDLIYMAATGMFHDHLRTEAEAIQTGSDTLKSLLEEVKAVLYANRDREGAAV